MARPIQVTVRYTGDSKEERDKCLEKAISQFKKLVMKEGLMLELKERESFQSPGRKRYLQRQKFYYRLQQKKDKAPSYRRKAAFDDKKGAYNNYQGRPQNDRRDQGKRPFNPNYKPNRQTGNQVVQRPVAPNPVRPHTHNR